MFFWIGWCTTEVKISLFRTFCAPMYTPHLWFDYNLYSIRKLYVAYNNALRILLNIPRYSNGVNYSASNMFVTNNVPNCAANIRKLVYSFIIRLNASLNRYVVNMVQGLVSDIYYKSRIWKHWRKLLFVCYDV